MNATATAGRRRYRQTTRAESAKATGERILDAATNLFWVSPTHKVSLDEVAQDAGVTVQTVIRRFGGKEGLASACMQRAFDRITSQRDQAAPGNLEGAVANLVEHYEENGARSLRLLAEEAEGPPELQAITEAGRRYHRDWCARVFAGALESLMGVGRERRLAQLVAICDIYTWKLLRVDSGLSRRQTELAIVELLEPLVEDE